MIYLCLILLSKFIFGNYDDIQDNWVTGSTVAFALGIPFLGSLFLEWRKQKFNIFSKYTFSVLMFAFTAMLIQSRIGYILLVIFFVAFFLTSLTKKFIFSTVFVPLFFITFQLLSSTNFISHSGFQGLGRDLSLKLSFQSPETSLGTDFGRFISIKSLLNKLDEAPLIEKTFGNGWYTSRLIMKPYVEKSWAEAGIISKFLFDEERSSTIQLEGIITLISDTGILGLFFLVSFLILNLKEIYFSNQDFIAKTFFALLLVVNFMIIFVGNPFFSIPFFLVLLPGGLLINLLEIDKK